MSAYIVATAYVTDPERFAAYHRHLAGVFEQYGGEVIVSGEIRAVLEGETAPDERISILRFPDEEALRAYVGSAPYREAKALRAGGGRMIMRLLVD